MVRSAPFPTFGNAVFPGDLQPHSEDRKVIFFRRCAGIAGTVGKNEVAPKIEIRPGVTPEQRFGRK